MSLCLPAFLSRLLDAAWRGGAPPQLLPNSSLGALSEPSGDSSGAGEGCPPLHGKPTGNFRLSSEADTGTKGDVEILTDRCGSQNEISVHCPWSVRYQDHRQTDRRRGPLDWEHCPSEALGLSPATPCRPPLPDGHSRWCAAEGLTTSSLQDGGWGGAAGNNHQFSWCQYSSDSLDVPDGGARTR